MARASRLLIDDFPLHIVQRGHNRERCFFGDADYRAYLQWLDEAATERDCSLHAYVLMTNHIHLLLTPRRAAAVPALLQSLGRRYVHYVNRKLGRSGTLWEGRYRSSVVQSDMYLLACHRYIELNPVRAGLASTPGDYRWSSYRANALGHVDRRLTPHATYQALGQDVETRCDAYRTLFEIAEPPMQLCDIRMALKQSQPLGNRSFEATIRQITGQARSTRPLGRPVGSKNRV